MDVRQPKDYGAVSEQMSCVCIVVLDGADPEVSVSSKVAKV